MVKREEDLMKGVRLGAPSSLICDKEYHYVATNGLTFHTDSYPDDDTLWDECKYLTEDPI